MDKSLILGSEGGERARGSKYSDGNRFAWSTFLRIGDGSTAFHISAPAVGQSEPADTSHLAWVLLIVIALQVGSPYT